MDEAKKPSLSRGFRYRCNMMAKGGGGGEGEDLVG